MRIVISGLAGSGKSELLRQLAARGRSVFDLDHYIHDIYDYGQPGYEMIGREFGAAYVTPERVDRAALSDLVFKHPEQLQRLNGLIQPIIRERVKALEGEWYVELGPYGDYEHNFADLFDRVVVVTAPPELVEHNMFKKYPGLQKFSTAMGKSGFNPVQRVVAQPDFTVDNNSDLAGLAQEADRLIAYIRSIT